MTIRCAPISWAAVVVLVCSASAAAQSPPPIQGNTTTVETLTLTDALTGLLRPLGVAHAGEALGLATALGVATAPLGAASGGFLIKLDPTTGLQVRTASTFGPWFAERAMTLGEGTLNAGVSFMSANLERLDDSDIDNLRVSSVTALAPANSRSGTANLSIKSKTVVISARMGVTDNLDIGVSVPLVAVDIKGTSTLRNGNGDTMLFAQGSASSSGLGDIAGIAKYRFMSFGDGQPDPGGLAVMATIRLPTGDRDNLRGLGVTRTLISLIASSGRSRFRPHANIGYNYWSKGVSAASDSVSDPTVTAQHQFEYAAGLELEAAPKLTLLVDVLGGSVFGGGRVGFATIPSSVSGVTSSEGLLALPEGVRRIDLAPGLKVNLKGKLLLSLNALVALSDSGLHAKVTPVAGIDLTF